MRDRITKNMISSTYALLISSLTFLSLLPHSSQLAPCSEDFTQSPTYIRMSHERNNTLCKSLPTLRAEFAWNMDTNGDTKAVNVDIFFGTTKVNDMGWVAWGVNPNTPEMVGTRAIIGIMLPNGSFAINTYNITADTKSGCSLLPGKIDDVRVRKMSTAYDVNSGFFSIFVSMVLPAARYNVKRLNHVWQIGHDVEDWRPKMHRTTLRNFDSKEMMNLEDGKTIMIFGHHRRYLRKVHGAANIIGWGAFLPIGIIIARYCKKFPINLKSWWFGLHVCWQAAGYTIGTAGWIVGMWLGQISDNYNFPTHRMLGIFIFAFATLQMLAFRLKPEPGDEYRKHWNVYHHFLGYALYVVISVNIFHGIDILKPRNKNWKNMYIGILGVLGIIVLAFEIWTWIKFLIILRRHKANDHCDHQNDQVNSTQINVQPRLAAEQQYRTPYSIS